MDIYKRKYFKIFACQYLMVIIAMFQSNMISCQSTVEPIIKMGSNNVGYNGETLKYINMGHVFNKDEILEQNYLKSVRSLKTAKWQGFTSLGLIGGGLLLAVGTQAKNCSGLCITHGQVFGFFSAFFIGPLLGTSALLFEWNGRSKQKRVLSIYNSNYLESEQESDAYLRISNPQDRIGIGLTLHF